MAAVGGKNAGNNIHNDNMHRGGGIELHDIPLQMQGARGAGPSPSPGPHRGNNNDDDYFPEGSQFSYEVRDPPDTNRPSYVLYTYVPSLTIHYTIVCLC